jgi:hypothetical protein
MTAVALRGSVASQPSVRRLRLLWRPSRLRVTDRSHCLPQALKQRRTASIRVPPLPPGGPEIGKRSRRTARRARRRTGEAARQCFGWALPKGLPCQCIARVPCRNMSAPDRGLTNDWGLHNLQADKYEAATSTEEECAMSHQWIGFIVDGELLRDNNRSDTRHVISLQFSDSDHASMNHEPCGSHLRNFSAAKFETCACPSVFTGTNGDCFNGTANLTSYRSSNSA